MSEYHRTRIVPTKKAIRQLTLFSSARDSVLPVRATAAVVATTQASCPPAPAPPPAVASAPAPQATASAGGRHGVEPRTRRPCRIRIRLRWLGHGDVKALLRRFGGLTCQFHLGKHESRVLPLGGQYLNATMAFDALSCGFELESRGQRQQPTWYDVVDVSLVDGYSKKIMLRAGLEPGRSALRTGPPATRRCSGSIRWAATSAWPGRARRAG